MNYENYMEDCLAQKAVLDIESYIDYWRQNDTGVSLRDFLGFDADEMDSWLKGDDSLIIDFIKERAKSKEIAFPVSERPGTANKEPPLRYRIMRFAVDEGSISERVKAAYSERDAEFIGEVKRIFAGDGWEKTPDTGRAMCIRLKRGKESLSVTPIYFDARIAEQNVAGFQKLLAKIKTYPVKHVYTDRALFDIPAESLIAKLEAVKGSIVGDLLESYRVDTNNICCHGFGPLDSICGKYAVDCLTSDGEPDYSVTAFIEDIFDALVERGYIISEEDHNGENVYYTVPDVKDGETIAKDITPADKTA